jgi:outer membrane protein OmpA-like peptidoglycan-associated protein
MTLRRRAVVCLPLVLAALPGAGATHAGPLPTSKAKVLEEGSFSADELVQELDVPPNRSWSAHVGGGTAGAAAPGPGRASILITFATARAELTPRAKQSLDVLAAAMKHPRLADKSFTIEGHADPRGPEERNLVLSQARADSVRDYLTTAHGLAPGRLQAVGKGSRELMNPGDPVAPENRRVTIVTQRPR